MTGAVTAYHPGSSAVAPLYDLRINPPYLVDYTSLTSGKHFGATKRRVRFRFGFSNADALADGKTGIECRGSEHDVTLVWSVTSGKRLVVADGKEVHFSVGKATQGKFQFAWNMRGNHTLKLIAHAAPGPSPLKSKQHVGPWRQFDLQLDGMSVLDLPRIYELGTTKRGGADMDRGALIKREQYRQERERAGYGNYTLSEEERAWAREVAGHERERDMHQSDRGPPPPTPPRGAEGDLRRSAPERVPEEVVAAALPPQPAEQAERSSSAPSDLMYEPTPTSEAQDLLSTPEAALDQWASARAQYYQQAQQQQHDEFEPRPAPPPTYNDVAGLIMSTYAPSPSPAPQQQQQQQQLPALPPSTTYEQPPQQQPPQQQPPQQQQPPPQQAPQYYEQQHQPQAAPQQQQPAPQYYEQHQQHQQYHHQQQQFQYSQFQYGQTQQTPPQPQPQPQQQGVASPAVSGGSAFQTPQAARFSYHQQQQNGFEPITPPAEESPRGVDDIEDQPEPEQEQEVEKKDDADEVGRALKNLVNLEDINSKPEEKPDVMREKLTMNPFTKKNAPPPKKKGPPRSQGKAPTSESWALHGRSLAEVKSMTGSEGFRQQPSREVMRAHAFDPAAAQGGTLVVYGQGEQGQGQGPPPLHIHQASGFGAGAHLPGGGYGGGGHTRQ